MDRSRIESILNSIADGVFTINQHFKITSFNRAAASITGFGREEAIGQYCREIFRTSACIDHCPLKEAMETGTNIVNLEVNILNKHNKEIPVTISAAVWKDRKGNAIGGVEVFRDLSPIMELRKKIEKETTFQDIISRSKLILEIFETLPDIAESDVTVLITGESGTGKELFAKAIHNLSFRKGKPFVRVNCGALPEPLLESELFGYKRGAFTDAKRDKPGRFKLADGGSLFLDETQVKLLRVLETKEYEPLGGISTEKADVRIISATHRDLQSRVESGDFREDLYYRLNVITIDIPPLRERPEDISLLIQHFLDHFSKIRGRSIAGLTYSAMETLLNHDYPGNVRELQNVVEHAVVICKTAHLGPECLPAYLRGRPHLKRRPHLKKGATGRDTVQEFEQQLIFETLRRHSGKVKEAAQELGMHRATLWRKIRGTKIVP